MTPSSPTIEEEQLRVLADYRVPKGVADELLDSAGEMRPVWHSLIALLERSSPEELERRFRRGDQYLRDAGVFYRHYAEDSAGERDWPLSHIPVVIGAPEWRDLSEGIVQRAELLERVVADLYGPANLVKEGLLPAELVAQNPEWLRPLVGVRPRSGHFLHFLAFEVGRSPDGGWFVLGDRTQAPSGAGFALENRVATARVFSDLYPKANVERLATFFRAYRDALNALVGSGDPDGRVAILTPGQHTDTYFEHAYTARYLGTLLLECADLIVENGRLMVRTITGPQPLDVVWRRLDARFADPLELDETSALGTPGMVGAIRSGSLTMVNALGSGVIEARAFLAFLPRIAQELTGEKLKLPNIATWWCGQAAELDYVRKNTARMMIGSAQSTSLPFDLDDTTALGGTFRGTARHSVAAWLETEGSKLVGQEAVTLSTTPVYSGGRLVPRPMTVRVFAARTSRGWRVMPGGYARIGRSEDPTALAMQSGGTVADVWVVDDKPVKPDSLHTDSGGPFVRRMPGLLPARAADNLFWLGRYIERAEGVVRTLRAYHLRLAESADPTLPLVTQVRTYCKDLGVDPSDIAPTALLELLDSASACASKVRDRFSVDGWMALSELARMARALSDTPVQDDEAARALSGLLRKLAGFSGLVHDNMFRFTGWRFLAIGRALERAQHVASVLACFADPDTTDGGFDIAVEIGDSVMTHNRRYSVETTRATVIDLLALDASNPRAILFQLNEIREQTDRLPGAVINGQLSALSRDVLRMQADLSVAIPEELSSARLTDLHAALGHLSDRLTDTYLA